MLLLLVNDFSEFSQIITKPVVRLRIKKFVCDAQAQAHLGENSEGKTRPVVCLIIIMHDVMVGFIGLCGYN